jgi:phospholipase A2
MTNSYYRSITFFLLVSNIAGIHAERINVYNQSGISLFFAPYEVFSQEAIRVGEPQLANPSAKLEFDIPSFKPLVYRDVAFSVNAADLKPVMNKTEYLAFPHTNVGLQGTDFYIAQQNGRITGFNTIEWHVFKKISDPIFSELGALIKINQVYESDLERYPYKLWIAQVTQGNQLSPQERVYRYHRKPTVKKAVERLMGRTLADDEIPVISVLGSGGGFRAMLYTAGALSGLLKIDVWDAITYNVGLSGSTWAIGLSTLMNMPGNVFKDWIVKKINQGLTAFKPSDIALLTQALLEKLKTGQPVSLVDLYGTVLANALLQDFNLSKQHVWLTSQIPFIELGQLPFPLYTAIRAEANKPKDWYEFSPYQIGAYWLNMYVPTWAFGRKFDKGISTDYAIQQSLGYLFGIFGSAYAGTVRSTFQELNIESLIPLSPVRDVVHRILHETPIGAQHIFPAQVYNFTYGMQNSPAKDQLYLGLADAGLDFNLPYPPVSGIRPDRKADIIICIDSSASQLTQQVQSMERYARDHALKFPSINYTDIATRTITVFEDKNDTNVPTLIYMPRFKEHSVWNQYKTQPNFADYQSHLESFDIEHCILKEACNTFNFTYTQKEAQQVIALAEFNIVASKERIIKAITDWINRKSASKKNSNPVR